MSSIVIEIINQRLRFQVNGGSYESAPSVGARTLCIGDVITLVAQDFSININAKVDDVTIIDNVGASTVYAHNTQTAPALDKIINAAFPYSNSGAAGSGTTQSGDLTITDVTKGFVLLDANGSGHTGRMQYYRTDDNNWTGQITQIS